VDNGISEIPQFIEALYFAAEKHRDQRRKNRGQTPYINHPIELTYLLSTVGRITDREILIAAVLHDTIEDTATTPEEIEEIFGEKVKSLVLEVTDDKSVPKGKRKEQQLLGADKLTVEARLIRIADKISNVTDLGNSPPMGWTQKRKLHYLDWTEKVVNKIAGTNTELETLYFQRLEATRMKISEGRHG
jgi:guanosine-3',5'-bis(diphosphate) 3'-pyrophosphohydrolase